MISHFVLINLKDKQNKERGHSKPLHQTPPTVNKHHFIKCALNYNELHSCLDWCLQKQKGINVISQEVRGMREINSNKLL